MRIFVFPGQGSQVVGMGKALAEAFSEARDVFAEVDDSLNDHLSRIMWEGNEDDLRLTQNAQPALMATSMAVVRVLESSGKSLPEMAGYVAGHSLGEYSALAAAGSIPLGRTAQLLRLRGEAMQRAVPVGEGAMAAVLGLSLEQVQAVAEQASDAGVVVAANDNADGQVVISGALAGVERAVDLAKEAGAKRSMLLPVSAPFHSPLMAPAADEMRAALADTDIKAPSVPVITNVTASPETDPAHIRDLLVEQVTASVRWRETGLTFKGLDIDTQVELGAGKVLSGLMRRIDRDVKAVSVETPAGVEAFLTSL